MQIVESEFEAMLTDNVLANLFSEAGVCSAFSLMFGTKIIFKNSTVTDIKNTVSDKKIQQNFGQLWSGCIS